MGCLRGLGGVPNLPIQGSGLCGIFTGFRQISQFGSRTTGVLE